MLISRKIKWFMKIIISFNINFLFFKKKKKKKKKNTKDD